MSEFEFRGTPGPWGSVGNGINDSRGKQVCRCPMGKRNTVVGRQWGTNALAIAAVPELIEEGANLLAVLTGEGGTKPEAVNRFRAALTKATGGKTDEF